jgi:signal peptidase II
MRNKNAFAWLAVSFAVMWLDWITKQWATESLSPFQPVEVLPWLNWILAHNTGAAFSFLADAGGWQRWFFTVLALVVTVALLVWLFRLQRGQWHLGLALGLLIGGAIGNLVDRLRLGYVVDFIDVHYGGWHWPAFNVADSAITCGIAILLLDALLDSLRGRKSAGDAGN